jgi:hypothetical protein
MIYVDQLAKEQEKCKKLRKKLDDALTVLNSWQSIYSNFQDKVRFNKDENNPPKIELYTDISLGLYAYDGALGAGVHIPEEIISKYRDSLLGIMKDTIDYYDKWTKGYTPLKENL